MYNFSRPEKGAFVKNNKFIFNGVNLSNKVVVEKIQRTLAPSKTVRSINMPGADGEYVFGSSYGTRRITLEVRIVENTFDEALETQLYLANVLSARLPKSLYLRDFETLNIYNLAMLTSEVDLKRVNDTLEGTIEFTCHNPFNYHDIIINENINSTPKVIINEGYEVPIKFTMNVTNNISGDVNITTIDGQSLILLGPFSAGSSVIYDDYKLRINGNLMNSKINVTGSSFIFLKNGYNTITVTGQGSNTCYVSFQERRL